MIDWQNLKRPIIALSPMADMTDSAFCRTVRHVTLPLAKGEVWRGSEVIIFREMVSSEAVVRGNQKTVNMTKIHPDERPLVQQIFGSDPEVMAEAVRIIDAERDPDGFDINMGCPVYKLVCNFNGASLMKEPNRATEIVRAMKSATTKPVSVKIRLGWNDSTECFDFAKTLEEVGVDMITVHGRTKTQGYTGDADWNQIAKLKKHLSIPVLANGDIFTAPLAIQALEQTKCDGIMIARGALGNPWIFSQINEMLQRPPSNSLPAGRQGPLGKGGGCTTITIGERVRVIKQHLQLHLEEYGEKYITTFRKHLTWYLKGLDGAKKYKERLHTAPTKKDVESILDEMCADSEMQSAIAHRDATHPDAGNRIKLTK